MTRTALLLTAWLFTCLQVTKAAWIEEPALSSPPTAIKRPHSFDFHGTRIDDPYFWMKDKKDPEVIRYLETENAYRESITKSLKPFEETLYNEMLEGGSAGGLLIGATLNLRPDICKVAHLAVPFVDVVSTMLDESLPLTVQEFLEWGNPKEAAAGKYMLEYSPYDNLSRSKYPAILVTTSLNDSQVLYHEPTKYVAKLRTLKTDANPLLLKCNMDAGHGGASGRYEALREKAYEYAYLLNQMDVQK